MEAKGPKGSSDVSKRQASQNGVVGARGIHEVRSYVGQETLFNNNAYTITSTYHGGTGALKLYTTHPTPSTNPNRDYEFRMTQLNGWDMTGNPDTFRQGAGALRNARDWAKEKRNYSEFGSSTQSFVSLSSNEPTHPESETSADELALDVDAFASSSRRTPVGARTKSPPKVSSNQRSKKTRRINKRSGMGSGGS